MGNGNFLYSIHSLRFLAASAVVFHHAGAWDLFGITVGTAGVDIFFVISGTVIGITSQGMPLTTFLRRRFIRVFPLYWIATAAMVAFKISIWHAVDTPTDLIHSAVLVPPGIHSGWL